MPDDPHNKSDPAEPIEVTSRQEDAETTKTRRELKQTKISEDGHSRLGSSDEKSGSEEDEVVETTEQGLKKEVTRQITPDASSGGSDDDLKEQVSSPKKKRVHDEFDEKDEERTDQDHRMEEHDKPANNSFLVSRTERSEPEKKRPRDGSEDGVSDEVYRDSYYLPREHFPQGLTNSQNPESASESSKAPAAKAESQATSQPKEESNDAKATTSASAFAKSGFAKLAASSTSGFGALGASAGTSPFGSAASAGPSPFSALSASKTTAAAPAPAKLTFGSANATASPFASAGLNGAVKPSGFGGFSSAFGSTSTGARLTSFASLAKPADLAKSEKPARPFGAPESDPEDGTEDGDDGKEEDDAEAAADKDEEGSEKPKEDVKSQAEDTKKPKLQKIVVDDGESEEATVLAVRAKLYHMEKQPDGKPAGWVERGGGMLKINVPKASIEMDDAGIPDISTFDSSVFETDSSDENNNPQKVRLIMRQDSTHRLLLNTTIIPAMDFKLNAQLKTSTILFTAFEADEVKQVQIKLSVSNANLFMDRIGLIQKQLADV